MNERAKTLAWDEAAEGVLGRLREMKRGVGVVGITGPVGAGKSHFSKLLCGTGGLQGVHLATDDYLPDYDKVKYEERDDPALADTELLRKNLAALRQGARANVPTWSFQTHSRIGYRIVEPSSLVIIEGIHALHDGIFPQLDLCVFVEAPAKVRWDRWEYLETSGQRGWGVDVAREFFHGVAEPTFERFAPLYRARAHFIVRNDSGVPRA